MCIRDREYIGKSRSYKFYQSGELIKHREDDREYMLSLIHIYMQAGDKSEQIKGLYVTQITEDGDLAVLTGSNQFSVSDKVIRGGMKIQKRDLETGDTKPQGSATLKDTAFDIISLNDNAVLVEGKPVSYTHLRTAGICSDHTADQQYRCTSAYDSVKMYTS